MLSGWEEKGGAGRRGGDAKGRERGSVADEGSEGPEVFAAAAAAETGGAGEGVAMAGVW